MVIYTLHNEQYEQSLQDAIGGNVAWLVRYSSFDMVTRIIFGVVVLGLSFCAGMVSFEVFPVFPILAATFSGCVGAFLMVQTAVYFFRLPKVGREALLVTFGELVNHVVLPEDVPHAWRKDYEQLQALNAKFMEERELLAAQLRMPWWGGTVWLLQLRVDALLALPSTGEWIQEVLDYHQQVKAFKAMLGWNVMMLQDVAAR